MYNYLVLKNRFEQSTMDKYNDVFVKLQLSNEKFKDAIESSKKLNTGAKKTETKTENSYSRSQDNNKNMSKGIVSKIGDIIGSTKFTYAIGLLALSLGYYWYRTQKSLAEEVF